MLHVETARKDRASLLIVDDEPLKRDVMAERLVEEGYRVVVCDAPADALARLEKDTFDVVVTDIRMPGTDGLELLRLIKERKPTQPVIVMTAYGSVESAVEAMKRGAYDYLQKPFSSEELMLRLNRLLNYEGLVHENEALRRQLGASSGETKFIGRTAAVSRVLSQVHTLAFVDSSILIYGESGTGKEQLARLIHETGPRARGPFVPVSCATLPRELVEAELFGHEAGAFTGATKRRLGRFELAEGGTIFLDDVDDIPMEVQTHLLRVIQERNFVRVGGETPISVNVRIVSATKQNLAELVQQGVFREDLYYRLKVVPLNIPPLRERRDDIPLLVAHLVEKLCTKLNRPTPRLEPGVLERLRQYAWPGNVRELENVLERMIALTVGDAIGVEQVPSELDAKPSGPLRVCTEHLESVKLDEALADAEAQLVSWATEKAKGNLAKAAVLLGVPRSTLQYKIEKSKRS